MYTIHSIEHKYATPISFSSSTSVVLSGDLPIGPTGREIPAQGRGRRPTPWDKGLLSICGLKGRENLYASRTCQLDAKFLPSLYVKNSFSRFRPRPDEPTFIVQFQYLFCSAAEAEGCLLLGGCDIYSLTNHGPSLGVRQNSSPLRSSETTVGCRGVWRGSQRAA
jgi:hypothetical protein